jgi:hypothetical protein
MTYAGVSLVDFLGQIIGSQQLGTPQSEQSPQQATTSSQPSVIKQPFPEFHKGTQEVMINPLTGEAYVPPKVFPSLGQASQTASQPQKTTSVKPKSIQKTTAKKPLTAETIEQTVGVQSSIPVLPYTPEGLISALSQGKISLPQAQQILKNLAQQDLSADNLYDKIAQLILSLPENVKKEAEALEAKMDKVYDDIQKNLEKQVKINEKYADEEIKLLREQLNLITNIFTDLMKEKPNLEPDRWTEFGRRLAMALGAISAMAHPEYAPYFYMAIPQVVQYWHNEDMQNFEKAMRKFELALQIAGTQLDFYNQIMERNLAILDLQKEKELLPLTLTGQLLMEKFHTYSDAYNKLTIESIRAVNDSIGYLLTLQDLKIKERHYKDWAEIQRLAKALALEQFEFNKWYKTQILAIRNYLAKIAGERLRLKELELFHPEDVPGALLPKVITKTDDPIVALKMLEAYGVPWASKILSVLQKKSSKKKDLEDLIF